MTPKQTIKALIALAAPHVGDDVEQKAARIAARIHWSRNTLDAFFDAQQRVSEAWDRMFDEFPENLDDDFDEELPDPPEQAEADALMAEIMAAIDHDKWPRHLHWTL